MRALCIFVVVFVIHNLSAGPIATLRLDKGVMVRSEIMYVDDDFYYCRKVTNPDEAFTVRIDQVPQSLNRRVQHMLETGELTAPPSSEKVEAPKPKKESGRWEFRHLDNSGRGTVMKSISAKASANYRGNPKLVFRFYRKKYDLYIAFDRKVSGSINWILTYQIDDGPLTKEAWRMSRSGVTAFSPRAFYMRDMLIGGRTLKIYTKDYAQESLELVIDLEGLEEALKKFEADLELHLD